MIRNRAFPRLAGGFLVLAVLAPWATPAVAREGELDLAKYQGRVVYLDFWASWCVPCRKSFPWLNDLAKQHPDDFVVIGVNVDNERAAALKFLEKYPAQFPLVFDPQGRIASEYRLEGMPSAVVLDRKGKEVHRHIGFREEKRSEYEKVIGELIVAH